MAVITAIHLLQSCHASFASLRINVKSKTCYMNKFPLPLQNLSLYFSKYVTLLAGNYELLCGRRYVSAISIECNSVSIPMSSTRSFRLPYLPLHIQTYGEISSFSVDISLHTKQFPSCFKCAKRSNYVRYLRLCSRVQATRIYAIE